MREHLKNLLCQSHCHIVTLSGLASFGSFCFGEIGKIEKIGGESINKVKYGGRDKERGVGWGGVVTFLSLREAYIPNLSLLLCLEAFEKFMVVGGGGG